MQTQLRLVAGCLLAALSIGCAGVQRPASADPRQDAPASQPTPKRITAAVASDFKALYSHVVGSNRPGVRELEQIVHAGLSVRDNRGVLRPRLAEAVPSAENGLWKVFPDGRMETTWRIHEGTVWQDGVPFTAEDLVFTARVGRDRETPQFRHAMLDLIDGMVAIDARTLAVQWKQPFIEADTLFGATAGSNAPPLPLPKHLLEGPYLENKAGFVDLPYWSEGYVGAGPYKVREWLFGSYLILEANARYLLGRPKIDVIEVRFFAEPNARLAALLANVVDLPLGYRGTSFEQALQLQGQWNGVVEFDPGAPVALWPQLHSPNPPVIGDVRFRRALLQAIDRQEMAATFVAGRMSVAHTFILPNDPEYPDVEGSIVRYEYDPRGAGQMIEGLGYTRGSDGGFRDPTGRRLTVEIRSSGLDTNQKAKLAVADYWQRVGVAVTPVDDPESLRRDAEYRATFPGFDTRRGTTGVEDFKFFRSSEARLPENRFVGQNVSNYMNPEMDALIDRYLVSIPRADRIQVAGQIVHHLTDQVIPLVTFYDAIPTIVGARLRNVPTSTATGATNTWNAHEWDVATP
jgi:peptide/nickel transport system substrate-binding protein